MVMCQPDAQPPQANGSTSKLIQLLKVKAEPTFTNITQQQQQHANIKVTQSNK